MFLFTLNSKMDILRYLRSSFKVKNILKIFKMDISFKDGETTKAFVFLYEFWWSREDMELSTAFLARYIFCFSGGIGLMIF